VEVAELNGTPHLVATEGEDVFSYPVSAFTDGLDLELGRTLELGVRPEDIRRVTDDEAAARTQSAPVAVVEPMGSDNFLYMDVGGTEWTARVDSAFEPDEGTEFHFTFDPDVVHLFDESGETIKSQRELKVA
jgi:multiple sugar transport system ATP-binding protein